MDLESPLQLLNALWSDINPGLMICCQCHKEIKPDDVLARTFCLKSRNDDEASVHTEEFKIPVLNDAIQVFYRHLVCLLSSTSYVAVSHVWHPQVASFQHSATKADEAAKEVASVVREVPARIYNGLKQEIGGHFEIWHDYISVPQWKPEFKTKIIQAIPRLFKNATMVVAYLADIDKASFTAMRSGLTREERCCGISDLCSARWFSRVWTCMELSQSHKLRAMVKDFKLIEHDPRQRPFFVEMWDSWDAEVRAEGYARNLEQMVGFHNHSLVPWQLGPIVPLREETLNGVQTSFAGAFEALSRRCLTDHFDFFHAMQNILGLQEPGLSKDHPRQAMLQIARKRLSEGDFSPFFITPASAETGVQNFEYGYFDIHTFAIGHEISRPTYPTTSLKPNSTELLVHLEEIGQVQSIRRFEWESFTGLQALEKLCQVALDAAGVNVEAFIKTIGVRFYGQELDAINERLSKEDRRRQLSERLTSLFDSAAEDNNEIISWVANAIGLSNTSLGGSSYSAHCPMSPMNFLQHHGSTMHHGDSGAIVNVLCSGCHGVFPLRVALFRPASSLIGVAAYRVPGLKYYFTHPSGAGFLLQDRRIVGRMIWAAPTCECFNMKEVEVTLDDLPVPQPNTFKYGRRAAV